tara:strand:- start:3941 stop:4228 length:288 start_codon:yes stop_codon:yes gene_type:complete
MKEKIKYVIPAGSKVRPSQTGYYNFWYPHENDEYEAVESFCVEPISWRGSEEWQAVVVNAMEANVYKSPIKVVWVKRQIIKDIEGRFYLNRQPDE